MERLQAPEPLRLAGNVSASWKRFKQKFELFLQATEVKDQPKSEASKAALLLSIAGDEALDVFNNFKVEPNESKDDYKTLIQKFDAYCSEVTNEVHERYLFRTRTQAEGEPFEKFLRDLKKQASQCNFGASHDSLVRDQIVFGTNNAKLREKMLREKELTLLKAENMCKIAESVAQQNEVWRKADACVDAISRRTNESKLGGEQLQCRRCNRKHRPKQCPAFGKKCYVCQGVNHFSMCCRKSTEVSEVNKLQESDFDVLDVCSKGGKTNEWTVNAQVNGQGISFKIDTGSQASLLPFSVYRKLPSNELQPTSTVLRAYNGGVITCFGTVSKIVRVGNAHTPVKFFIVKNGRQPILGLEASESLGLVHRTVDAVNAASVYGPLKDFRHVFEGLGCLKQPYHMVLKPGAVPVVQPARRVPLALEEPLKDELERMARAEIIVKEQEPTDWESGDDFWQGLLAYRSAPLEDGRSPGELLQGRRLRANLPDFHEVPCTEVKKHCQHAQGKPLPKLSRGDVVRLRGTRTWSRKARVRGTQAPRSYQLVTEHGQVLRRNRKHLIRTDEPYDETSSEDGDDTTETSTPVDNPQVPAMHSSAGSTSQASESSRTTDGAQQCPANTEGRPTPDSVLTPAPRRWSRNTRPPQRLRYDEAFNQIA
nr:uncharacterized protein LOC129385442 [Dermacentor andersoni]